MLPRRLRSSVVLALFLLGSLTAAAQQRLPGNSNIYNATDLGVVYDNEVTFNFAIATPRNFFFGVRSGKLISYDKTRYWSLSFGDIRHSRERRENPEFVNPVNNRVSRAYVFGKQNQLYALRLGFGSRKLLSEKARQRGVAVGYSYEVGPSLGIVKPYYIELLSQDFNNPGAPPEIRYTGDNANLFLNQGQIFGGAAWTTGLEELGIRPGVSARFSTHFGFGAFEETAKSIEAGVMADFFLGDTDIMIESELTPGVTNSPLFLSLFVNLQIGKRW